MKQVELREETLRQEHESRVKTFEDRIEILTDRLKERDGELATSKIQTNKLEDVKRRLSRQVDQMVEELKTTEDKKDYLER